MMSSAESAVSLIVLAPYERGMLWFGLCAAQKDLLPHYKNAWNYLSPCTLSVTMILHEKHVPFEYIPIDLATGEHKTLQYVEKHPFGQVPYIDDDGFILYESRAIARYLCDKYPNQGAKLVPTELDAKALFEQAASVEAFQWNPFAAGAVYEKMFKVLDTGVPTDEKMLAFFVGLVNSKLEVYERILSKQKYLAGNEVTLADLFHNHYAALLPLAGIDALQTKPNLSRWWNDLSSRESWLAVKDGVSSVEKF